MKAVILAGGSGTRLAEETDLRPKPMIEIGEKPILWHILKIFSTHGINEFIICLGYKGYVIKEYFANYLLHHSDVTIDLKEDKLEIHREKAEPWKITLVDTGAQTMTGGRIQRIREYVKDETFLMTYGDGVGDIDITKLVKFHESHGLFATVTATRPPGRFGALQVQKGRVENFREKPLGDGGWINGGFFVLTKKIFDFIKNDSTVWENEPLAQLAEQKQLAAYLHEGFWQPMDTLREKRHLDQLWNQGGAPWKIW